MLHSLLIITFLFMVRVSVQQNTPSRVICTKPNEEWTACGPRCGEACADQGRRLLCPMACSLMGGCSCKEGYARDSNRRCIPKRQCPPNNTSSTCGRDEEYLNCGSACPPQCGDELMGACIMVCKRGCFCKNGLVRNPVDNRCIRRSQCPTNNVTVTRCAAVLCLTGTVCVEDNNGARCERQSSNTCANVRCAGPCEDTPNGPICRPRNITDVCSGNPCGNPCQRCIPEPKQCFTTPCPQYRCEQITGCLGPPIRPNKPGNCPKPGIGICVESCQTDASCQGSQKCCSNGCGRVCTDPINLQ